MSGKLLRNFRIGERIAEGPPDDLVYNGSPEIETVPSAARKPLRDRNEGHPRGPTARTISSMEIATNHNPQPPEYCDHAGAMPQGRKDLSLGVALFD